MKEFLQRWLINTVGVLAATSLVPGMRYDSAAALIVAALVLGILNAVLRPLLLLLALPLLVYTLGLFFFVINALMLYWAGKLVKGFHVDSFGAAFWGSLVILFVSVVLGALTGTNSARIHVRRGGPPAAGPPRKPGDDDGPVIDV